jgi:hypothetical protein
MKNSKIIGRVGRYQSGNQNQYIEEEQTTQWPKGKVQKDQQRSTKHTYKMSQYDGKLRYRIPQVPLLTTNGFVRCMLTCAPYMV